MEFIDDPDPEVATSAVRYLALYGDKRAQQPILSRYISWSEQWAGKADELEPPNSHNVSPNWAQRNLGEALGDALLQNQGWITDAPLRSEVLKRCVGEQLCRNLHNMARTEDQPYMVYIVPNGGGADIIRLGSYEIPNIDLLKAKLSQYPRDTKFALLHPAHSSDTQLLEQQVQSAFDEAHLTLVDKP